MPLSGSLIERLAERLSHHVGRFIDIEQQSPIAGGSINDAYRLDSSLGPFFVKVNRWDRYPNVFEAEADGLHRLKSSGTVLTPQVIDVGEDHDDSYLLLEWVNQGARNNQFWETLGRDIAALHSTRSDRFGLDRDNWIGSLKQSNAWHDTWHEFYITCRLEPLLKMAIDRGRLGSGDGFRAERLFRALPGLYPHEAPGLLHGDLWSGNVLCTANSAPVLIDPAVYHGHREMDLAMTGLFGGFDRAFLAAYDEAYPLDPGWRDRMELWQLYPLLVHLNLFGSGYRDQVVRLLKRYGSANEE